MNTNNQLSILIYLNSLKVKMLFWSDQKRFDLTTCHKWPSNIIWAKGEISCYRVRNISSLLELPIPSHVVARRLGSHPTLAALTSSPAPLVLPVS